MLWQLIFGFYLAAGISVIAWWRKALDVSGAIAAVVTGTIIFGLGGLGPSVALVVFFATGSILSGLPNRRPTLLPEERKGRSWLQVAANGSIPVLAILVSRIAHNYSSSCMLAYYGSVATSCSDTWGTEIGVRYSSKVRDILSGRMIESGISGGVSVPGLAASVAGAVVIAFSSALEFGLFTAAPILIASAGILGSASDSILGCSLQAKYRSPDGLIYEKYKDAEGGGERISGYRWITNNMVNFFSTIVGAATIIIMLI